VSVGRESSVIPDREGDLKRDLYYEADSSTNRFKILI